MFDKENNHVKENTEIHKLKKAEKKNLIHQQQCFFIYKKQVPNFYKFLSLFQFLTSEASITQMLTINLLYDILVKVY